MRLIFDLASFIKEKKEVSWEDIRREFSKNNPNTLGFQLGKLLDSGFARREEAGEEVRYCYVKR